MNATLHPPSERLGRCLWAERATHQSGSASLGPEADSLLSGMFLAEAAVRVLNYATVAPNRYTGGMSPGAEANPIFHLSFPVNDLDEAIAFYSTLGGIVGRREAAWADIALFGAQVTLQHVPEDVLDPMPRSRHFGATLPWQDWEQLVRRITGFVEGPRIDYSGTNREQAKAMIADPSGNLIELKAYRHPTAVLGPAASGLHG